MDPELLTQVLKTPLRQWLPHWWYDGYLPGMPDLFLIALPPNMLPAGASGYYLYVSEVPDDRRFLEACLDKTAVLANGGLALPFTKSKQRKSRLPPGGGMVMLYQPPAGGANPWTRKPLPWVTMSMLPTASEPLTEFLRGRYGVDLHDTETAAVDLMAKMRMKAERLGHAGTVLTGLQAQSPPTVSVNAAGETLRDRAGRFAGFGAGDFFESGSSASLRVGEGHEGNLLLFGPTGRAMPVTLAFTLGLQIEIDADGTRLVCEIVDSGRPLGGPPVLVISPVGDPARREYNVPIENVCRDVDRVIYVP